MRESRESHGLEASIVLTSGIRFSESKEYM